MKGAQWPIAYRRRFSHAELVVLRTGLCPRDMDDRWIIWLDADVLRLWRSWTQSCVYGLPITLLEDGTAEACVALVLDETESYRRCPTEEGELHRLVGVLSLILNRETVGT